MKKMPHIKPPLQNDLKFSYDWPHVNIVLLFCHWLKWSVVLSFCLSGWWKVKVCSWCCPSKRGPLGMARIIRMHGTEEKVTVRVSVWNLNKLGALHNKYPALYPDPLSRGSKVKCSSQQTTSSFCQSVQSRCVQNQSIRFPQIVKRSISSRSFLGALWMSSVPSCVMIFSSDSSGVVRNWSDSLVGRSGTGFSIWWTGWFIIDWDMPSSSGSAGVRKILWETYCLQG